MPETGRHSRRELLLRTASAGAAALVPAWTKPPSRQHAAAAQALPPVDLTVPMIPPVVTPPPLPAPFTFRPLPPFADGTVGSSILGFLSTGEAVVLRELPRREYYLFTADNTLQPLPPPPGYVAGVVLSVWDGAMTGLGTTPDGRRAVYRYTGGRWEQFSPPDMFSCEQVAANGKGWLVACGRRRATDADYGLYLYWSGGVVNLSAIVGSDARCAAVLDTGALILSASRTFFAWRNWRRQPIGPFPDFKGSFGYRYSRATNEVLVSPLDPGDRLTRILRDGTTRVLGGPTGSALESVRPGPNGWYLGAEVPPDANPHVSHRKAVLVVGKDAYYLDDLVAQIAAKERAGYSGRFGWGHAISAGGAIAIGDAYTSRSCILVPSPGN